MAEPCSLLGVPTASTTALVLVLSHSVMSDSLWTVAYEVPPSMEFSRQGYWSRLPFPPPGDLPDSGIEPVSFTAPALAGEFFPSGTWENVPFLLSAL